MEKFSKQYLGTILEITIFDEKIVISDLKEIFKKIEDFENKYSRFIKGNFLDTLNNKKSKVSEDDFLYIVKKSLEISEITEGYYDISVRNLLENYGYGIAENKLENIYGYKNININGNKIELQNNISIELGSIGKGYLVDLIYDKLSKSHKDFIINFGGDIKVSMQKIVGLEDPIDNKKIIGKISLDNSSLSCSSAEKRKLINGNSHLIELNGAHKDKIAVYIKHTSAIISDAYATAIFVTPLEKALKIFEKVKGLDGLIIGTDGKIYKSKNFEVELF